MTFLIMALKKIIRQTMRFGDQISIYFVATTMVHEMIAQMILKKNMIMHL